MAVLFTGDRVDAARSGDADVRRLCSAAGACAAVRSRLPAGTLVLPVAPRRYTAAAQAAYDGWLPAASLDDAGLPRAYERRTGRRAWRRLAALLRAEDVPRRAPLLLLGFSKGAVPVNQLLAELAAGARGEEDDVAASSVDEDDEKDDVAARLNALRSVHLLDAGAQRRGAAYLTDAATLDALRAELRRRGVAVRVHGTPRQWADAARPWLLQEAQELVRQLGDVAALRTYFDGEAPSLAMHFRILEAFDASS